jgi:hypothetical protein
VPVLVEYFHFYHGTFHQIASLRVGLPIYLLLTTSFDMGPIRKEKASHSICVIAGGIYQGLIADYILEVNLLQLDLDRFEAYTLIDNIYAVKSAELLVPVL